MNVFYGISVLEMRLGEVGIFTKFDACSTIIILPTNAYRYIQIDPLFLL